MGGMVRVAVEATGELVETGQLSLGDDLERGRLPGRGGDRQQLPEVIEAERDIADHRCPCRVRGSLDQPRGSDVDRRCTLLAGRARWSPTRIGERPAARPGARPERGTQRAHPPLDRGSEQDRRAEDPRSASIGRQQRDGMPPAEAVGALEALAKADVEHPLGDDRVERRRLRAGTDRAKGTTAALDRGREPHVDQVARRQASGRVARHAHANPDRPVIATRSMARTAASDGSTRNPARDSSRSAIRARVSRSSGSTTSRSARVTSAVVPGTA